MKVVSIVILAIVATASADRCENFDEIQYSIERQGLPSAAADDAEATSTCQKDETLVACRCGLVNEDDADPCDGATIKETAEGFECVARNNAEGSGVVAVATCQETVITCESEYGDMPSVSCPESYRPISCTMHTSFMHQMAEGKKFPPRSRRNGNLCYTSRGCTNCKVQARCIRKTNFKIQKNAK